MELLNEKEFTKKVKLLNNFVKSMDLTRAEELLLLRTLIDFYTDERVLNVFLNKDYIETTNLGGK